jgi:hypothetical protein
MDSYHVSRNSPIQSSLYGAVLDHGFIYVSRNSLIQSSLYEAVLDHGRVVLSVFIVTLIG